MSDDQFLNELLYFDLNSDGSVTLTVMNPQTSTIGIVKIGSDQTKCAYTAKRLRVTLPIEGHMESLGFELVHYSGIEYLFVVKTDKALEKGGQILEHLTKPHPLPTPDAPKHSDLIAPSRVRGRSQGRRQPSHFGAPL